MYTRNVVTLCIKQVRKSGYAHPYPDGISMSPTTLSILLMMGKFSVAESVLRLSLLRKHVFRNAPSNWHSYIDKLLYITAELLPVEIQLCLSDHFIALKSHIILYHRKRIDSFLHVVNYIYKPTYNFRNSSLVMRKPFGKIKINSSGIDDLYGSKSDKCEQIQNKYKRDYHWSLQWRFLLDKHLKINLTFEYIHISLQNNFECYIGKLEIKDLHSNDSDFLYCGLYSNLIVYPPFSYIKLHISLRSFVSCQIQFSFAVMDSNRIVSFVRKNSEAVNPVWSIYFNETHLFCERFHLMDQKFKYLNITFLIKNGFAKEVFDGPGTMSEIIQPLFQNDRQVYVTSTFQCVIHVYFHSKAAGQNIAYDSITVQIQSTVTLNRSDVMSQIKYPNCQLNSDMCVILIKTIKHFRINLTVSSFTSSLKRNDHCYHGGLTIFDKNNQNKTELSTLCMNHSFLHRYENIYSTHVSMLLIFYSYPEFGELHITVELRPTNCKVIILKPCVTIKKHLTMPETGCIVYQFRPEIDINVYESYVRCGTFTCNVKLQFNTTVPDSKRWRIHTLGYLQGEKSLLADSFRL